MSDKPMQIFDIYIPCRTCGKLIPAGGNNHCLTCRVWMLRIGESMPKWISVKDRLPENRDDVLLCRKWWNEIRNPQMGWYNDVSRSWFDLSNREIHNVTHWMPLPEPPKEENDG